MSIIRNNSKKKKSIEIDLLNQMLELPTKINRNHNHSWNYPWQ